MILTTWLSCMSTYTSFRPEMIIFQQVSNVVWGHWIKKRWDSLLLFLILIITLSWSSWETSTWDIIIITYPWGERLTQFKWEWPFFFFFSYFFSIEQWWWHQWNAKSITGYSFNRKWDRTRRERERERGRKKKVINLSVCIYIYIRIWWRLMVVFIDWREKKFEWINVI